MGLSEIRNERILKLREKLLGYKLKFVHIKGSTHALADRLSRYPEKTNTCLDLEDKFVPSVCSKSLRTLEVDENPKDHHLEKIGRIGKSDKDYSYMAKAIKEKNRNKVNKRGIRVDTTA